MRPLERSPSSASKNRAPGCSKEFDHDVCLQLTRKLLPPTQISLLCPLFIHTTADGRGWMVLSVSTAAARHEKFAGQTVAIFDDGMFVNGCSAASQQIAQQLVREGDEMGHDDAFSMLTMDRVVEQHIRWRLMLPRVKPFYAVKCNNDPVLLQLLADLGCGFDCASRAEIESVIKSGLATGDNVVYANPCKTRSYIRHAEQMGIRRMTFDSIEELVKIKEMHASPQLILRIAVADPTAQCPLATKFGCDLDAAPTLLRKAVDHGMELIGISFHVGSGCRDPTAFCKAIAASKKLFLLGTTMGLQMKLLDIGGGFPGHDTAEITFGEIVTVIQKALDKYFPQLHNGDDFVQIIAEPGRFFGSSPVSLCTNVISVQRVAASRVTKRPENDDHDGFMLYINDGVYGSFNCILFDHFQPRGRPLFECCHYSVEDDISSDVETSAQQLFPTIVWGQTCDGLDQVEAQTEMRKMNVGEWLYYENMGAYTSVAASNFNGFDTPNCFYAISESTWKKIEKQRQLV